MSTDDEAWFIYDGDCPICSMAAQALRFKQAAGPLHLLNAREESGHPLLAQVKARQLDLDEGMVIIYGGQFYHGAEALYLMAMLSSGQGWFNRMNAMLFRSKRVGGFAYPFMRGARNLLLRLKGVQQIRNLNGAPTGEGQDE